MLDRLKEIMETLPWDRIEKNLIYVELDEVSHQEFVKEVEEKVDAFTLNEKIPDMGSCIRLTFMGRNLLVVVNKRLKEKVDTAYVAFKTKII